MYLTQMHLNPSRRGTRWLLASPQRMHAAVLSSFPPGSSTESPAGRVLWRVDNSEVDKTLTLYVSSPASPDLTAIAEQAGWPATEHGWRTASLASLLDRLHAGQQWGFRLTANPVQNLAVPGERGKRRGHVTVAYQQQWFLDRAARWGFTVEAAGLAVHSRRTLSFSRRSDGTDRTVTVTVATYEGILTVTDPESLRRTLCHGVGRAKAYGCGLLTLAPVP
jgi:CRISPR system Cascade subunit CasE